MDKFVVLNIFLKVWLKLNELFFANV